MYCNHLKYTVLLMLAVFSCFSSSPAQGLPDFDGAADAMSRLPGVETRAIRRIIVPVKLSPVIAQQVEITQSDQTEYGAVLTDSRIKLTKLRNDPCGDKIILDVSDTDCAGRPHFVPGSYYSFFIADYVDSAINIGLLKSELWTQNDGKSFQYLADLGDVDLNAFDKKNDQINALARFRIDRRDQRKFFDRVVAGIDVAGLKIRDRQPVVVNHTYFLRSIFSLLYFRGSNWEKQILIVFRVLKRTDDTLTIAWRKLGEKWA